MSTLERKNRIAPNLPYGTVLGFCLLLSSSLGTAPLRAQDQDVAEAARQARERKAAQQNAPHHVYTGEDLKRNKIIAPEDEARVNSHTIPAPEKKNDELQATEENKEAASLGEVARRYRREKAARRAEQAAKNAAPSRYPLEGAESTLAAPKPEVAPSSGSLREDELKSAPRRLVPAPRNLAPLPVPGKVSPLPRGNSTSRLSPFAPREAVAPRSSPPAASLAELAASLTRQKVQPGDSWWILARRYLGKGSRWEELVRVNPGLSRNPERLPAGIYVFVPGYANAGRAAPRPTIIVQKGDTLWSLAGEYLGGTRFWPQLAAANPEITQFTRLQVGTKLALPQKAKSPHRAGPAPLE